MEGGRAPLLGTASGPPSDRCRYASGQGALGARQTGRTAVSLDSVKTPSDLRARVPCTHFLMRFGARLLANARLAALRACLMTLRSRRSRAHSIDMVVPTHSTAMNNTRHNDSNGCMPKHRSHQGWQAAKHRVDQYPDPEARRRHHRWASVVPSGGASFDVSVSSPLSNRQRIGVRNAGPAMSLTGAAPVVDQHASTRGTQRFFW